MVVSYTISDVLGFASIGCWLGAQFPQVLENIRRQSCEGLALPFLANWFLGDISNLIGCILTHQLPFQTYLATYFVFVDCMLLVQYFYYYQPTKTLPPIHGRLRSATLPLPSRRFSIDHYRTLSAVASNVANAAAMAALQDEPEGRHASLLHRPGTHRHAVTDRETEHDEDGEPPADMIESFYSEGGRGSGSRRVSWSIERSRNRAASVGHPIRRPPRLNFLPPVGLSPSRNAVSDVPPSHEQQHPLDSSLSPATRSSQARRGSALVFLGVWALFSFGTLTSQGPMYTSNSIKVGTVLSSIVSDVHSFPGALRHTIEPTPSINIRTPDVSELTFVNQPTDNKPSQDSSRRSSERVVGRIFAWTCATLYFTSRLPQIWKNYARKSVEGLSMYLFVFAFLGNTFYVASIICSPRRLFPPHEASAFIRESIPYLIGSAGTLMFDVTIVSQSFCYRPRHRRYSIAVHDMAPDEEESGLLSDDALGAHPPAESSSSTLDRGRTSHVLTST